MSVPGNIPHTVEVRPLCSRFCQPAGPYIVGTGNSRCGMFCSAPRSPVHSGGQFSGKSHTHLIHIYKIIIQHITTVGYSELKMCVRVTW